MTSVHETNAAEIEMDLMRLVLEEEEVAHISLLIEEIKSLHTIDEEELLRIITLYSHRLPERIRRFFNDFKTLEQSGICIVSGYPVNNDKLINTPKHWKELKGRTETIEYDLLFLLFGSLLGELFGWGTQQDGRFVHDIAPIKGNEEEQLGSGSKTTLMWHTEDSFHPYRADYFGLMCMRNFEQVATTYTSRNILSLSKLSSETMKTLSEPRFIIQPDNSHKVEYNSETADKSKFSGIKNKELNPDPIPVLFGDLTDPYICIDPHYMYAVDEKAAVALQEIIELIDENLKLVVLSSGDVCFIDNYISVHGRQPFVARYDGQDRWLKRIFVTRDLRRSRGSRQSTRSRLIY